MRHVGNISCSLAGVEFVVVASAHRHGVEDDDMTHAVRNSIAFHGEDDLTMAIGPARSGAMLEVGFVESAEGLMVIVHAMPARSKFLR